MQASLFGRVVVPVANPDDAAATATSIRPYLDGVDQTIIAVHVIEKAGGAPDKASVEQREEYAADVFLAFTGNLADTEATVETEILYGTDTAETIIDSAHEQNASAIVFTPRGASRWKKLLTGDVTHKLVSNSDIPIIVVPNREDEGTESRPTDDRTDS